MVTTPPRSIAVVGVGGIGSSFAYQLARKGHDVTVVARPGSARLHQLQRDQGIVRKTGERADVRVTDVLDEQVAYDVVLVTTLAHQVDAVLPALQRSQAACVHFMFNNFDPERLRSAMGAQRCSFGMPFATGSLDRDGKLTSTVSSGPKTLHSDQRWVDLFRGAGLPSAFEPDMLRWLRCHVPLCLSFESIAVAGQRRGGGASWAEAMVVARGMHAGFAVVRGLGYRLYPRAKSVLNASPTVLIACMLWLLSRVTAFRELLAQGVSECRALGGVLANAAGTAQPPLPAATVAAVRAMIPAASAAGGAGGQ